MDVFRRMLPRRIVRDQYSFELLKSSSAQEFRASPRPDRSLPRYFSQYDTVRITSSPSTKRSEEVIDFSTESPSRSDESLLVGFVAAQPQEEHSFGFVCDDASYEKAIAECHVFRDSNHFAEGVLLKCVDNKPLFPYMHLCQFHSPDYLLRQQEIDDITRQCQPLRGSLYGGYEEVYSIQKTSTANQTRLPAHRHAGYIVIGFKLLDDASKQKDLEKSWLSWSGAREIYKHSPRGWNLRRISLLRHPNTFHSGHPSSRPFVYILLCEYGSILHPANTIQALDMCERLRVRNCGHIALYQVHTVYSSATPAPSRPRLAETAAQRRSTMIRGFSQDVDSTEPRRSRLRARQRSFQCADEQFFGYH